jgi:hypothetical protein
MELFKSPTVTSVLNKLTNYSHTAIGTGYAVAALLYHVKTSHDLGNGFVTFSGYFYAFLLGHAAAYQKWPDKEGTPNDDKN